MALRRRFAGRSDRFGRPRPVGLCSSQCSGLRLLPLLEGSGSETRVGRGRHGLQRRVWRLLRRRLSVVRAARVPYPAERVDLDAHLSSSSGGSGGGGGGSSSGGSSSSGSSSSSSE